MCVRNFWNCCRKVMLNPESVMLNLFQHLIKSKANETLKQVQGDTNNEFLDKLLVGLSLLYCLNQLAKHILGISKNHIGLVHEKKVIFNSCKTFTPASLYYQSIF